jgi:hypothetical protein
MSQIEIAAELVRLVQVRVKATGCSLANELARLVAEEMVTMLDPELNWLVEPEKSLSDNEALTALLAVNDLYINGFHLDIRPLEHDHTVTINRALVGTSYLTHGTLVVELLGAHRGRLAGYVSAADWMAADRDARDSAVATAKVGGQPVELDQLLTQAAQSQAGRPRGRQVAYPDRDELEKFVVDRLQLSIARQRQIVEGILSEPEKFRSFESYALSWSNGSLAHILTAGSVWNKRADTLAEKIAPRFKRLNREQIKRRILQTGENSGGQPQSPQFRRNLLANLAKDEILARFKGADASSLSKVVDSVFSGKAVMDTARDMVKSKFALELAVKIKAQRKKLSDFASATAEEIAMAFSQLALQPAYATHSASDEAGTESVNDALTVLQAAELAAELKKLELDIG